MSVSIFFEQFVKGINAYVLAYDFAKRNEIWRGLLKQKWIILILLLVILFIGYHTVETIYLYFAGTLSDGEITVSEAGVFSGFGLLTKELFFGSSIKYVMLVVLEVVTFHCSAKTLSILTGKERDLTFKDFYKAQIRMIKVVLRSWVLELIVTIGLTLIFALMGFEFLKYPFIYIIQFYFLGLAFLDNYLEQYRVSIKESELMILEYAGASVAIGLLSFVMVFIPIIGPMVAPIMGAVSATIYLHTENTNGRLDLSKDSST